MKILVACEFSGRVRDAFIRKGHDAISCDILDTESPGPHYKGDVRDILYKQWDMIIAFPPCTHLSLSGARYWEQKRKDGRQQDAIDFFNLFTNLDCPRISIENPVGIMSRIYRKPDQVIHPYWFGDPTQKKTCLWLKGLPLLVPTDMVEPEFQRNPDGTIYKDSKGGRYSLEAYSGRKKDRAKVRGKTYLGVAKALATQYTAFINSEMTVSEWENLLKGLDILRSNAIIDKYVQL